MKFAVISDIHANPWALEVVLEQLHDVDEIFCLGDVVGIGPDPSGALEMLMRERRLICVMGNHDHNTIFGTELGPLNFVPRRPHHEWVRNELSEAQLEFLKVPMSISKEEGIRFQFMHRHPQDCGSKVPYFDDGSPEVLDDFYSDVPGDVLFFGHTHFEMDVTGRTGRRYLNPGAVGAQNGGSAHFLKVIAGEDYFEIEKASASYDLGAVKEELDRIKPPYWEFIRGHFF
ncbi:MAG: metallophosphoesterase family protein [Thermoplasmatota archaeon]